MIRHSGTLATLTVLKLILVGLVGLTWCLAPTVAAEPAESSPWTLLENLRNSLQEAGPTTASFVQTYVPAGFDSGDRESGHLSLWLPDCLRWNYADGKNFLVCQGEVYAWNEEESGGRRHKIDPREEPGLDLLLVQVENLRERYSAGAEKHRDGGHTIDLATPASEAGSYHAKLEIDRSGKRVTAFEYRDTEGNLTRFEMKDYQNLNHTALFQPPSGVEWTEE